MGETRVRMKVNGRHVEKYAATHLRLLDFLRDELNLTGAKEGCGAGECGTCSVFVDGKLMKSCLMPVGKAQNRIIDTVEGLAGRGELTEVQRAFCKTGASQCGYCIPGMVMAATEALRESPCASSDEIKEYLGGNICRCTGYQKIFEAVELARDVMNGSKPASALEFDGTEGPFIGANVHRIDAPSKVTGALKYAADMVLPGMLHMLVLRSSVPHARIVEIDTAEAEQMPGVEAVITHRDVPGTDGFGVFVDDQPIMAREKVRYTGEAIAAVAAVDLQTARDALKKIVVTLEELPVVFDTDAAVAKGAPVIHDYAPNNIVYQVPVRKGDVERGFAEADLVVDQTYQTQAIEHAYLEPEAGIAFVDHDGVVTIHSPSQNITHHRHMLSRILALPINKVRMIMSPVGGGFGGKEDMIYQGMLALAAMKSRMPVRLVFTREESICTTAKRHPFNIAYRMGLKKNGRITAVEVKSIADGGAYGMSSEGVIRKHAILTAGPYDIPNVKIDVSAIYTNNTPSGAFRSFGAMQGEFATESHLDICAEKLGMDPVELRRMNIMGDGAVTHTKQRLDSVSIGNVMDACAEAANWEPGPPSVRGPVRNDLNGSGVRQPCTLGARIGLVTGAGTSRGPSLLVSRKKRGRGIAASWYGIARTATTDRAGAWVEIDDGGTAKVLTGVTEIGEGILTVLAQVAAEELGVRPEDVTIGDNDTARVPEAAHAGATRQTYMIANAVALGCRDAKARLVKEMGNYWEVEPDLIRTQAGRMWVENSNLRMTMEEAVDLCKKRGVVPVGSGSFASYHTGLDPVDGSGRPWQAYVFGAQIAEVEVDTATGEVQVLGIWAAHDVGRAVNPRGVQGQIEGGVVMALGQALMEDYTLRSGYTTTPSFAKYILPTSLDVPQVTSVIIEDPDPLSPLGAKGIGEPAMVPTAPAIMNAIYDAVGVRITSLPASPERILEGLRKRGCPEPVGANGRSTIWSGGVNAPA